MLSSPRPKPHSAAAQRERAVLAKQQAEDRAVAIEEQRAEAEQLDLLGVVLAREQGLEVGLLARFGRAPAEQPERIGREARLGDEHRHRRDGQHDHRPGRERDQQPAVDHDRHGVLHQAERALDQAERPRRRLAPRARHAVVELRVLEVGER